MVSMDLLLARGVSVMVMEVINSADQRLWCASVWIIRVVEVMGNLCGKDEGTEVYIEMGQADRLVVGGE